ncbi:pig-N [Schizosaccharomyces octosporus yFS286]|uniref:GPI ethanolamine phosphate transferase 1 n=1 Tax=Schizosaccharomyces octosporus (strain yFS286) TaxID=483514 RepID=S9Q1P7_SCHOY|nr:pig-N [Schizosaccharomyces octosporus yFS286]EPX75216.1 pig-N [Schizosaccharomyces octosporus yFS286]
MFGRLLILGILFHLVYVKSIFDIYFVTPLAHGMGQYAAGEPPANRLFLIVGDGLRPDKLFQPHPESIVGKGQKYAAPFLRSVVLNNGTFGISHTRVPTESRPGHVALIAGFYEDVSAVTKGWKTNPVNFDSVFNQSRHTFSFGSEDILPMFSEGASDPARVDTFMYGPELEDFSGSGIVTDEWVFDRVDQLFEESYTNRKLWDLLHQDKIVFFLHLLGIDTIGHNKHPDSIDYMQNIQYIDQGIKELVEKVNRYYENDDASAWVFTADHGMSDYGSHGDGAPENTRTPIVAWGAGLNEPAYEKGVGHDEFSVPWDLSSVKRVDIRQADVAALMSYLVGVNFPVNSVGQIPLDFLNCTTKRKAEISLLNALAIGEQYNRKAFLKAKNSFHFRPYTPLKDYAASKQHIISLVETHIQQGNFKEGIIASIEFSECALQGLRYLQRYDWFLLRSIVLLGYLSWITYVISFVFSNNTDPEMKQKNSVTVSKRVAFNLPLLILSSFFYYQSSPSFYYAYAAFPTVFLQLIYADFPNVKMGYRKLIEDEKISNGFSVYNIVSIALYIFGLLQFVVYSYFHREGFSVFLIIFAAWPWFLHTDFALLHKHLVSTWSLLNLSLCSFTLLPATKKESLPLIFLGGLAMITLGCLYILYRKRQLYQVNSTVKSSHLASQIIILILSFLVTLKLTVSLQKNVPISPWLRMFAFFLLISSYIVPLLKIPGCNHYYLDRLAVLFLTLAPTMCMFSISFESLFYLAFFLTLGLWTQLEAKLQEHVKLSMDSSGKRLKYKLGLSVSHFRVSLFFYIFLNIAFFGTGNIASLSSFALDSVKRLVPVFNPVTQGALLLYIIIIPFVALSASFGIMNKRLGGIQQITFFLAIGMADFVTINFFYLVKDEGSWQDIGISISHFCISNLLILFIIILERAGAILSAKVSYHCYTKIKAN